MTPEKVASTALYSEMNRRQKAARSFKKRMQLLLRSGLIKGTIPMSMQRKSNQLTLDTVLKERGGEMRMLDLFSGIGGFHKGFKQAGNAVTVDVVQAVAERMRPLFEDNEKN